MPYKVTINTDAYRPRRCSAKNWEPGTTNSIMRALNGWHCTELHLRHLRWRLEVFLCGAAYSVKETEVEEYEAWLSNARNHIEYHDMPCDVMRVSLPECPGWHQGYTDIDKCIDAVLKQGSLNLPFSAAYDTRQYYSGMNGCYLLVQKV